MCQKYWTCSAIPDTRACGRLHPPGQAQEATAARLTAFSAVRGVRRRCFVVDNQRPACRPTQRRRPPGGIWARPAAAGTEPEASIPVRQFGHELALAHPGEFQNQQPFVSNVGKASDPGRAGSQQVGNRLGASVAY